MTRDEMTLEMIAEIAREAQPCLVIWGIETDGIPCQAGEIEWQGEPVHELSDGVDCGGSALFEVWAPVPDGLLKIGLCPRHLSLFVLLADDRLVNLP